MISSLARRARPLGLASIASALLVAIALPRPAHAFCRTTTVAVPPDFSPTRGCFTSGFLLFWRNACVTYSIHEGASRNIPYDTAEEIIDRAFGSWMGVACAHTNEPAGISVSNLGAVTCSEVGFNKVGPNQNVIVFRDDTWPYTDANSTLGLTTVTFNAENGEMFDADMEINASGRNLSTADQVPANGFDLESVIAHEAGHFFGLAHSTDTTATMFASYKPGRADLRSLAADDASGLCSIYPDDRTRVVSLAADPNGRLTAGACSRQPIGGFTSLCSEPVVEERGCSTVPQPGVDWSYAAPLALGAAGVLGGRRLRRAVTPRGGGGAR